MSNMKISAIVILALATGLGLGYIIFPGSAPEGGYVVDPTMNQDNAAIVDDQIWTCAMHPQIRQNEPGNCPICEMELIPLVANTSNDPLVLQMTPAAVKLLEVQTFVVGGGDMVEASLIRFTGKIQADERLTSSQVAHIPGRIEQLFVTFTGEEVKKGQALAVIYSPDLITAQRELIEALKLFDINPELVEASRNKLRFWRIPSKDIEEIEKSGVVKETFTIYSDAPGVVTKRRIAVGDYVMRGEPLFDMVDLSHVWVLFDAYEEDLPYVKLNDIIEFYTPSIPNKSFKGPVTFVDPFINSISRVAAVRTEIDNKYNILKPEMFVYGSLKKRSGSKKNLTIPKTAVLWTGKRSVVYVRIPDAEIPSFQFREVELGASVGSSYILEGGLEEGEEIVTNGNFAIDAAAQLNNQVSMMNRNVAIKGDNPDGLPDYTEATPEEFKQQLAGVMEAYLQLKDAFVATDVELAKKATSPFIDAMDATDMTLLKGAAHMYWMDQVKALKTHSEKIAELEDIEDQRTQFVFLSQAIVSSIKVFGVADDDKYYVQHCPMANNGEGADWISTVTEINNPYYGDAMLRCGSTMDTIDKDFRNMTVQTVANRPPQGHNH